MALADKTLMCVECGEEFIFTAGEQEFFNARGFSNEPKRCRNCRAVRRTEQRGAGIRTSLKRCTPSCAPTVAPTRWCPFAPAATGPFIAATALVRRAPKLQTFDSFTVALSSGVGQGPAPMLFSL